jgi:hypothetical protein
MIADVIFGIFLENDDDGRGRGGVEYSPDQWRRGRRVHKVTWSAQLQDQVLCYGIGNGCGQERKK